MDEFREDMNSFDGTFPQSWRPEVGDIIVGQVTGFSTGPAGEYGPRPIIIMQDETTEETVSVWLLSQILIGAVQDARPRVGDRIGIKRLADRTGASGRTYKNWLVRVDRKDGAEMPDLAKYMPSETLIPPGAEDDLPF